MPTLPVKLTFLIFLIQVLASADERPKFSDAQIIAMTPHYFNQEREAPKFLAANFYLHPQEGKTFQVEVRSSRNLENAALIYCFQAMITLTSYGQRQPKRLVVVLHGSGRGIPPVICKSNTKCSVDYFVHGKMSQKEWINSCLLFQRP
ncbi:MAG: hypothetical protein ACE5EE_03100 [Fidelibacterota bacterium]